jgi:DNA-directed RNA polymerase beta subunit
VIKYISERNHKLRYTLKDKKTNKVILVVLLKLLLHDTDEEINERTSSESERCEESPKANKHEEKVDL